MEAFVRNFTDAQAGGCCTYARLIDWLAGMQGWYGATLFTELVPGEPLSQVLKRTGYDSDWLSGQGPDVPSVWGVQCRRPGTTSLERRWSYLVHTYDDGYTFNGDVRPGGPTHTYETFIGTMSERVMTNTC